MPRTRGLSPREKRLSFRLADEEREALKQQAAAADMDLSDFIRAAFPDVLSETKRRHKGHVSRPGDDTLLQCRAELHRVRVNMEALVAWCRTYKGLAETVVIQAHLLALEREVAKLTESLRGRA